MQVDHRWCRFYDVSFCSQADRSTSATRMQQLTSLTVWDYDRSCWERSTAGPARCGYNQLEASEGLRRPSDSKHHRDWQMAGCIPMMTW